MEILAAVGMLSSSGVQPGTGGVNFLYWEKTLQHGVCIEGLWMMLSQPNCIIRFSDGWDFRGPQA